MAHCALYYPGWGIAEPGFLFESLLYWDRLACVVPYEGFRPQAHWPDEYSREAGSLHERFVTGLAPDDRTKDAVHSRLSTLLDTEPPDWCRAENLISDSTSVLAVRKVSPRTIDMLTERGWLAHQEDDSLALISRAASGIVLGALVEEMTSAAMPAVTDNSDVFRASCNGLLRELQSPHGLVDSSDGSPDQTVFTMNREDEELAIVLARIVKLGIDGADVTPRMLGRLSKLRDDSGFNEQRARFREHVDRYVSELRNSPISSHQVVHDHWEQKLKADRKGLKRELRRAGIKSVIEKEGILATGIGALAGSGALAAAGPVGLIVGCGIAGAGILDSTRRRRAEVIEENWTSWLYSASGSRLFFRTL